MADTRYRADIDGLRAIAVLSVLLFHLDIELFSGGFVGVDVFFVISGYLITRIIHNDLQADRFSLLTFYERRVRRIFPALFTMLAVTMALAWWLLLPIDLYNFAQSVVAATLFASNLLFIFEAGYFDAPAELKPLLHTWSLSVEEQYYVIFPLLMAAFWRWARTWLAIGLIALMILSFAWSLAGTWLFPITTFFLSPPRFWELLIGAALAIGLVPQTNHAWLRHSIGWAGLLAIAAACLWLTPTSRFPGFAALLPCLGAAAIIWAGSQSPRAGVGWLLSLPAMVGIGLISYSLYLWHWPLIVFFKYVMARELTPLDQLLLATAAAAMATLSWRLVEQPYRHRRVAPKRTPLFAQAGLAMSLAIAASLAIYAGKGMPWRLPDSIVALDQDQRYVPFRRTCRSEIHKAEGVCIRGDEVAEPRFMLLGDSHAAAMSTAVFTAAQNLGHAGIQLTVPGYRPFLDFARRGYAGLDRRTNSRVMATLDAYPDVTTIILQAHWRQAMSLGYIDEQTGRHIARGQIDNPLDALLDTYPDRNFIILEDYPISEQFGALLFARQQRFGRPDTSILPRIEHERHNAPVAAQLAELAQRPNVTTAHFNDVYCNATTCPAMENGRSLYRDADHVSLLGTLKAVPFFEDLLKDALSGD